MSTRRARIKAVAALPQRRKNADNKNKQEQAKEIVESVIKSPKVRRTSVDKVVSSSPGITAVSPRKPSPRKSPRTCARTPNIDKVSSEWKVPTQTPVLSEKHNNTPLRDKTDNNKRLDVFVSPQARASPLRKHSPAVRTPIIEVDVGPERHITAHKRLIELQEDAHKSRVPEQKNPTPSSSSTLQKNDMDGYNSPNTPEAPDVMDGIVPLKPDNNTPKPINYLKNEIISENVEVLFDPIVPLPSPTKVRQKLRPVPRLGPTRRNSVPGSASESEDESRRVFHGGSSTPVPSRQRHDSHTSHSTMSHPNRDVSRVRNDSICSSVSQLAPQTPAPGSPMKEKNVVKSRRVDVSRRMAAMRRRKESVQRDKLTMFDLIFYNPLTNPIVPDQDEIKAKEATKKEAERKIENKKEELNQDTNDSTTDSSAPVPQIKLGPNGEIMLDEQSLVIKQSEQRKLSDSVVHEGAWMSSSGRVYPKAPRTAEWSDAETIRFYRAIAALGTDFSLMVSLFPGRTRKDLKLKFKKEEKVNLAQIDKALRSVAGWDADRLEIEFADERKLAAEKALSLKERLKKEKIAEKERYQTMKERRVRQSKGSKALGTSILPTSSAKSEDSITANELLLLATKVKAKERPRENNELSDSSKNCASLIPFSSVQLKVGIPYLPNMADIKTSKNIPSLKPQNSLKLKLVPQSSPAKLVPQNSPAKLVPQMSPASKLVPQMSPASKCVPQMSPASKLVPQMSPASKLVPQMSPASKLVPQMSPAKLMPQSSPATKAVPQKSPVVLSALPQVPSDIVPGSLVVLTVDDPKAPSKKAIHTYIKQGDGSITSIILDPKVMNSLVSYVKKDTPKAGSSSSVSPSSVASDRTSTPPVNPSPKKRKRNTSYTIVDL